MAGKKPNPATPADRRLKANQPKPAKKATPPAGGSMPMQGMPPKGMGPGMAPPFGKGGKPQRRGAK